MLSIIIPARNESDNLKDILDYFTKNLIDIEYEVVLINDFSNDDTFDKANSLFKSHKQFRVFDNQKKGLGGAINTGIQKSNGSKIAIMMADLSDSPQDLVRYWEKLNEGYDCIFGSRFISGSRVTDYPRAKLFANRIVNTAIRYAFRIECNDITNAFKMYRREVIEGCQPLISPHFNLTVEISKVENGQDAFCRRGLFLVQ